MNFLLHRHLAARDLGTPAAGAAAMLPDLWRMADRRVRPSRSPLPSASSPTEVPRLADVLAGIEHHIATDRWFHAAPAFLDGERLLVDRLRAASLTAPRLRLFAHVLWEMCLDGALLRRVGLDRVLADLRAGLDEIDGPPSDAAASLHHFDRVTEASPPEARPAFDARMRRLRDEVARGPWIAGYRSGEGLALRLAGVRARFGFSPFTPEDLSRLIPLLDGATPDADAALDDLLTPR